MARLGFVGTGAITAAMVRGLRRSTLRDWPVLLSPRNAELARDLAASFPDLTVAASNQAVADGVDLVVLAVRPQVAEPVPRDLRLRPDHTVISLIAGLDHELVRNWTGAATVCRAIPLPFVAEGQDATPVFPPDPAAVTLFDAPGRAQPVADRRDFDILAALSALMASYFGLVGIAAGWAADKGPPEAQARAYLSRLFANLGGVLRDSPLDPDALRAAHSTAGGLNEQVFADFLGRSGGESLAAALDRVLGRITGSG
jgi:pyrroline-5-carboxylate reductase